VRADAVEALVEVVVRLEGLARVLGVRNLFRDQAAPLEGETRLLTPYPLITLAFALRPRLLLKNGLFILENDARFSDNANNPLG